MSLRLLLMLALMLFGISCAKRPIVMSTKVKSKDTATKSPAVSGPVMLEVQQGQVQFYFFEGTAAKAIGHRYFDHAEGPQLLVKNTEWQDQL